MRPIDMRLCVSVTIFCGAFNRMVENVQIFQTKNAFFVYSPYLYKYGHSFFVSLNVPAKKRNLQRIACTFRFLCDHEPKLKIGASLFFFFHLVHIFL